MKKYGCLKLVLFPAIGLVSLLLVASPVLLMWFAWSMNDAGIYAMACIIFGGLFAIGGAIAGYFLGERAILRGGDLAVKAQVANDAVIPKMLAAITPSLMRTNNDMLRFAQKQFESGNGVQLPEWGENGGGDVIEIKEWGQ